MWMFMILFIVLVFCGLYWYTRYQCKRAELKYPPSGKFISIEGIQLHYKSEGSGQPVIFLHGGVLTSNDFDQVLDLAAAKGFQAIAFDRPGYGFSERPQHKSFTPVDQARLIHLALKDLGSEKPIIVAHSWSGIVALSYALLYPQDIAGIVTLGGALYKEGYPAENGDPISTLVTTPVIGNLLLHTLLRSPLGTFLADRILKATFAPESIPTGYRDATHALWLRPRQFKANREDVMAFSPAAEEISKRYKEIDTPTVIVVGSEDPFGTIEQAQRLERELPNSEMLILPKVAHMIPQNHPEWVIVALNRLVRLQSK